MVCEIGKFILRRNCTFGSGFTAITCKHKYNTIGQRPEFNGWVDLEPNDVVVNEDGCIGANVILCPGTMIGSGSVIAAGSVCVKNQVYPSYAVIGGNPAKFIKFRLSLEEQILQVQLFYSREGQFDIEILKKKSTFKRVQIRVIILVDY